ncbi:hypothetical protein CY658_24700 [Variovorax sp. RO1]|uniref:nucleotidyl transferase AbiEii/AbiGii toxin family protein n=1 Tax=Variovorax sp. RO1 TaxID=2066034 RepID=UPI000C716D3F|nr:nucleotidyl transferase AbiEii/AbiGii toxin family protein [Variovorax sp. RO1]PLC03091.1 hypothetical protein CY658_24700 [Variovorax sp. RO1]
MTEMHAYDDRSTHAVYSVLIELGQVLGAYTERFVVVGGSVPWLLLPRALPRHIGTIDVDLSLDHEALGDGEYVNLVGLLERAGYERGLNLMRPFQMVRSVDIDQGPPINVIIDFLMPRKAKLVKNDPPLLAGFAVQRADGLDVANAHFVKREFSGYMPDGRHNTVQLRIASIPALLVMKGYALVGRDKPKDAYDIYYVIRHYEDGLDSLADACRPLLTDAVARNAYANIAAKFSGVDAFGPQTVRKFLVESGATDGMSPAQIAQDAFGQVSNWLNRLGQ